jgi:uncharacterized protein
MSGHASVQIAGVDLHLLPERAIWAPALDALLVADVHWGKAAAFRHGGIPVPRGTTRTDLDRLTALLSATGARRLVILGDLLHARSSLPPATLAAITAWRAEHAGVQMLLVRGNHDRSAGDPPAMLDIACVDEGAVLGPFALHHHPRASSEQGYVLAGHVHPLLRLTGRGRQRLTLPCFAFTERSALLPAFGGFTGGAVLDAAEYAQVFVIADSTVVPAPVMRPRAVTR